MAAGGGEPALDALLRERLDPVPAAWDATPLRRAAVLAPLFARGGEDFLLFTVRRSDLSQHAGQIAFPGGMEAAGERPADCALRECEEEIGLARAGVVLLGALPSRESSSAIAVHCLVGRVANPAVLRADPREVERLFAIPFAELRDASRWELREAPPQLRGNQSPPSPHFEFGGDVVWGLTGRFVHDLVQRLAAR